MITALQGQRDMNRFGNTNLEGRKREVIWKRVSLRQNKVRVSMGQN